MKGGGSQTSTTKTVLPSWINKAAKDYLAQARGVASGLAQPYQGQVVAEMTDAQKNALARMGELSNFNLSEANIGAMMNPYIQNVEQAALAQGERALARNLSNISDAGLRAGGAFGSRQGVLEGAAASEQALGQAGLSAQLRQQGFQQAVANTLAGQQAALQAAQAGFGAGSAEQQQRQRELTAEEMRYNAMRGFPLEQLNIFGSALGQVPYGQSTTQSTPTSGNPFMGAIGGALGFGQAGFNPFLGGALGFLGGSDRSMKTDIEKIGEDEETGLNMYAYRYKGDPKTYPKMVGPMADEIEEKYPDKVKEVGGKKVVAMNFLKGKVKT